MTYSSTLGDTLQFNIMHDSCSYVNDTHYKTYTTTAMMEDPAYISFSSWDAIQFMYLNMQPLGTSQKYSTVWLLSYVIISDKITSHIIIQRTESTT